MPRPRCRRLIGGPPGCVLFEPAGVPASTLTEVILGVDELEAIRLADLEGLYQEQAAERMNVSRQTFGRIVADARMKVARALVEGMSLRIEGGEIEMAEVRRFACMACGHAWQVPFGTGRPAECPECRSTQTRRTDDRRGAGGGTGAGFGRGRGAGGGRGMGRGRGRGCWGGTQ